jgi:chromosome segregation ATPase
LVESIKSSKSETELKIRQIESINQSDQEYIEELLNKNRDLYDENQKLKSALEATVPSPSPASIMDQNILISKQYEEITRLNDLLLNKENETKKLAEENEQLRTTINSGKWKSDREPSHYPSLFPPQSSEEHESPTQ